MGQKKSVKVLDALKEQGVKAQKIVKKHAETLADQVKDVADDVADKAGVARNNIERKLLKPVFPKDIKKNLTKMIRIVDHDIVHENSEVCAGAFGFKDYVKGEKVLTLYTKYANSTELQFDPLPDEGVYLSNPYEKNKYIEIDEYYDYIIKARVTELTKIAQDLGAKHIKITWEEEEEHLTSNAKKVKASVKAKKQADTKGTISFDSVINSSSKGCILYESDFAGSSPVMPILTYYKNEKQIENLVNGRLNPDNPLGHQTLSLELKRSCGIKMEDAITVDAAIKKFNIAAGANSSFKSATERQYRSKFKYEVDF